MSKANFFIVGEPKCATTALHKYLSSHKEIFMSEDKEPNYFASDLQNKIFYKNQKEYDFIFQESTQKIIGESSTNYLYSKKAAENIFRYNPNAKILAVFREPVDLLYAYYHRQLFILNETEKSFENALNKEIMRKNKNKNPSLYYSERIKFAEHIERYLKIFPTQNIKIMFFEDFIKDKERFYFEILEFLDVEITKLQKYENINSNKKVRFKIIRKIAGHKRIWPIARKIFHKKFYDFVRDYIMRITSKEVKREKLNAETTEKLKIRFNKEVRNLNKILRKYGKSDRDLLTFWKYKN